MPIGGALCMVLCSIECVAAQGARQGELLDDRIARLRRKVEPDPAKPQVIKTVRGAGYMFSLTG